MAKQSVKCPQCQAVFEADLAAGQPIQCPACEASLTWSGKTPPATPADRLVGERLGDFEVTGLLGRGGMGSVYRGRQVSLDRPVALKVLSRAISRDAAFVARFTREARSAAAMNHPNIIKMLTIGQDRGLHFMAMELVEGETVAQVMRREGRVAPDQAVAVMKQTAAALAHAHAAGIVHRDIKPSNILVRPDGVVKVADFGLAKRTEGDVSVTQVGQALGTPLYMAPEVASGKDAEPRSDLYSLGATFYHALAGRPPFQADTAAAIALKHVRDPVPPLADAAPGVPDGLCRVIHRLMRKNPAERYGTAQELIEALDAAGQPAPATRSATRPLPKAARPAGRRVNVPLLAGAVAGLVAVVLAIWAMSRSGPDEHVVSYRPPTRTVASPPTRVAPPRDDAREQQAAACLAAAQRAAMVEHWGRAQAELERLRGELADTRFCARNRQTIADLHRRVTAALPARPASATPAPKKPAPPPKKLDPPPKKKVMPPPRPELDRFCGILRVLGDGRTELRYGFADPAELNDWQCTAGPEGRIADRGVEFGGPQGNSLMLRAEFEGDIEIAGAWRQLTSLNQWADCSVNFCNSGNGHYYAVSLGTKELKIFKDDGVKGNLIRKKADCPVQQLHRFRLVREGEAIRLWVNDELQVEARDTDYRGGQVGLGAWFARVAVEDLRVTAKLSPDWLDAHPGVREQLDGQLAAARKAEEARKQRQEAEAALLATLKPAEAKIRAWDFPGALAALDGVKSEHPALTERVVTLRLEIGHLSRLQQTIIAHINRANPKLDKRSLLLPGHNGPVEGATAEAITATPPGGGVEKHAWAALKWRTAEQMARRAMDAESADGWLALALLALAYEEPAEAEKLFAEARQRGARVDRHLDRLAAAAFAAAKVMADMGLAKDAAAALRELKAKYANTPWFAAHQDDVQAALAAAQAAAKPPLD